MYEINECGNGHTLVPTSNPKKDAFKIICDIDDAGGNNKNDEIRRKMADFCYIIKNHGYGEISEISQYYLGIVIQTIAEKRADVFDAIFIKYFSDNGTVSHTDIYETLNENPDAMRMIITYVLHSYIENECPDKMIYSIIDNVDSNYLYNQQHIFETIKKFINEYENEIKIIEDPNKKDEIDIIKKNALNVLLCAALNSNESIISNNQSEIKTIFETIIRSMFLSVRLEECNRIDIMSTVDLGSGNYIFMESNGYLNNFNIDELKGNKLSWLCAIVDLYNKDNKKYLKLLENAISSKYFKNEIESYELLYFYSFIKGKNSTPNINNLMTNIVNLVTARIFNNIIQLRYSQEEINSIIGNCGEELFRMLKDPKIYTNLVSLGVLNVITNAVLKLFKQGKASIAIPIALAIFAGATERRTATEFDGMFFSPNDAVTMANILFNNIDLTRETVEKFKDYFASFPFIKESFFRYILLHNFDCNSPDSDQDLLQKRFLNPSLEINDIIKSYNLLDDCDKDFFLENLEEMLNNSNGRMSRLNCNEINIINKNIAAIIANLDKDGIEKFANKFVYFYDTKTKGMFINILADYNILVNNSENINLSDKNTINANLHNLFNKIDDFNMVNNTYESNENYYNVFSDYVFKKLTTKTEPILEQNQLNAEQLEDLSQNLTGAIQEELNIEKQPAGLSTNV